MYPRELAGCYSVPSAIPRRPLSSGHGETWQQEGACETLEADSLLAASSRLASGKSRYHWEPLFPQLGN